MPKPSRTTQDALSAIPGPKTDRGRCVALGLPLSWRGTIGRIRNGFMVSMEKENEVRLRLNLPALSPPLVSVHPCPSCAARGIVRSHADGLDCNGNGGHAIVLAPGETVRRPGRAKRRPPVRRPWMGAELTAAMDAAGMTDENVRQIVARWLAGRNPGEEGMEVQP